MRTDVKKEKTVISIAFLFGASTGIIWSIILLILSISGRDFVAIPFSIFPFIAFSVPSLVSLFMPVPGGLLLLTEVLALILAYFLSLVKQGIGSWIFVISLIFPLSLSGALFVYGGMLRAKLSHVKEEEMIQK